MMAGSTQHTERLTRNNGLLLLVDHRSVCTLAFVTSTSCNSSTTSLL